MTTYVSPFADPPFAWGDDEVIASTGGIRTEGLVNIKYTETMEQAKVFIKLLLGSDECGTGGYLGALNDIITSYTAPNIEDFTVTIPTISFTPDTRPAPDLGDVNITFPVFDVASPTLTTLPTIDLSELNPADLPAEISAAIAWTEESHNNQLFTSLLARMLNDLTAGATGLDATVEAAIYARARARLSVEEDALQTEIEEYFASTGFDLPPLALASRLQEHADARTLRLADVNNKILEEQGRLAQTNSQFVITAAKDLEAVLRDATDKRNDRSLDYAKAVAANAIAVYAENIKAYIAAAEANKIYVEVQVANLEAIVAYNAGLIADFAAQAEAYQTVVEAQASGNKAITDVYESEVKGYTAEMRAIADAGQLTVEEYKLKIQNADIQLRTAIAEIEAELQGYTTESSLRERVAESMANLALQAVASAYGSTNMGANLSHSTGVQRGEQWGHTENRQVGYGHDQALKETHNTQEAAPVSS